MGQTVTERRRRGTVGSGCTTAGRKCQSDGSNQSPRESGRELRRAVGGGGHPVFTTCQGPSPAAPDIPTSSVLPQIPFGSTSRRHPHNRKVLMRARTDPTCRGTVRRKDGVCQRHLPPAPDTCTAVGARPVHPADAVQYAGTPVGEGLARRGDGRTAAGSSCSRASDRRTAAAPTDHHPRRPREQRSPRRR